MSDGSEPAAYAGSGAVAGDGGGAAVGKEPLLLGVRHHGPGSARAVRAALEAARPRVVLIEGPPEADALIPLAAEEDMRPPVALLAHAVDEPGRSAFWPLAEFSPEWVAIRWALEHEVPARFIDLPATHSLAWEEGRADEAVGETADPPGSGTAPDSRAEAGDGVPDPEITHTELRIDPLAVLAETAGYDDPERWWEDVVEHQGPVPGMCSRRSSWWRRPWGRCGRCTGVGAMSGISCGRRICGSKCGRLSGSSGAGWSWCAGRGTCPRCGRGRPSPPTGHW